MSDITNVKEKVISSLIWKMMERIGTQGVQFVVQLILARLLLPEDYGILAITTIFISIANVFIQTGFTTSIVQKKEIDEEYTSSMFYLMLIIAIILYMVLFLTYSLFFVCRCGKDFDRQAVLAFLGTVRLLREHFPQPIRNEC